MRRTRWGRGELRELKAGMGDGGERRRRTEAPSTAGYCW
jgi:hypothetical protein